MLLFILQKIKNAVVFLVIWTLFYCMLTIAIPVCLVILGRWQGMTQKLCVCRCVLLLILWYRYKLFCQTPCNLATRADAVRWQCLEFQHLAVTPAGFESARFYKWMRGRCVVTALRSLGRISVTLWQLANLRLLSSLSTYSIQPRPVRTPDLISNHSLFWRLSFA